MKRKDELPECPVALTVGVIGSKWKLLILRELLSEARRFGELLRALEGISKKVLTESLRALEADGVVARTAYPGKVPAVDYALTPLGRDLLPLFDAMAAWGETYRQRSPAPRRTGGAPGPRNGGRDGDVSARGECREIQT